VSLYLEGGSSKKRIISKQVDEKKRRKKKKHLFADFDEDLGLFFNNIQRNLLGPRIQLREFL